MDKIVIYEVRFFLLLNKAVAHRGQVFVVVSIISSFSPTGEERRILKEEFLTFATVYRNVGSDQSAGGMPHHRNFIADHVFYELYDIVSDADQVVFFFVMRTLSMTVIVHHINMVVF